MENIPETGYISPEEMATCLSVLTNVEEVIIVFRSAPFSWDKISSHEPLTPRAVLPALTSFGFRGHSWYLEALISQIDVPILDNFEISFFTSTLLYTPLLCELISRMETSKGFHRANLTFHDRAADITLSRQELSANCKTSKLYVVCGQPELQLLYMTRFCRWSLPPLSTLKHLYVHDYQLTHFPDEMDSSAQWLELFLPFTSVEDLYLSHELALYVTRALPGIASERFAQVLPALQVIFLQRCPVSGVDPEVPRKFITIRQFIGRPVSVHYYNNMDEIGW
jgi:hypothetical protein